MSSVLRALRRLESDARHREDDDATLHEHVVVRPTKARPRGRAAAGLAALLVVVSCSVGLFFAALRWMPASGDRDEGGPSRALPATLTLRPAKAPPDALRSSVTAPRVPSRVVVASMHASSAQSARVRRPATPVAVVETPPPAQPEPRVASKVSGSNATTPVVALAPHSSIKAGGRGAPVGVDRIHWHPRAEKRRAWLVVDGEDLAREVREGEQVGRFAVTRIDAGSVLFRSGKTEIRYKLGADQP